MDYFLDVNNTCPVILQSGRCNLNILYLALAWPVFVIYGATIDNPYNVTGYLLYGITIQ